MFRAWILMERALFADLLQISDKFNYKIVIETPYKVLNLDKFKSDENLRLNFNAHAHF